MPPKTLTAEQVAEIDRQQQKPVNWSAVIPQKEDVLTARVNREAARQDAPAMLTAEQTDAAEAQNSVAAETSFGRAMGARPDRSVGPQVPAPKKVLSASEVDQADYERVGNISYIPTKDEWKRYSELRQRRDDKVGKFFEAGQAIAGGLVQAAAATAYAPFDFVARGTKAYDEWVNSSAEGMRQASISTAELWSWANDVYDDNQRELQRNRAINDQVRQRLAAENRFTGNPQQDEAILEESINQAKAQGLYEKTPQDLNEDEDAQYQRFIRDRSFQQQAANVTETNIGTLPDGRAEMGIDESKLNEGLVLGSAIVFDPLNPFIPAGLGAINKLKVLRRVSSLAGKPLKLGGKVAGGAAQKAENLYSGIVERVEGATGIGEAGQAAALSAVSWKAAAAMATLKGSGKLLRRAERGLETGSIIAREIGIGGVGASRVEAASKLRSAPIPERYRRAYDGFFTSADSTLRRVSETQGLSPIARRSAATLDKLGATQVFRAADDAVSGAAATAPIAVPLAAIAPEERQPEILGAIMTVGAGAGVIGGKMRRMSEFDDALVAKMLADAEISGGDATSMANMMPHDRLVNMARMQSVISPKADFIPLRATDYEINTTVKEAMGLGTRGIYVDAKKGQRPRIFVNLDKMATGDVAGHEVGHAILKSDILGGEVKRGMRAMVDQQYGTDGVAARGREYVTANLTQEVRDGTTGIQLNVLRPDEVTRIAAAGGDEAAEQALKNEFIRERWANDTDWRKQAIEERADMLNQERLAQGEISWDWARDEIAAETFSGLGKGLNLSGIRASGPLSRAVGAASAGFEAMGARMRGNGRLETPNRLFVENPLFDTPEMRKAVNNYVKTFDRYLVGLEKEGSVKQRGTPIAPTGKAQDAARSPHTRTYSNRNGTVIESDLFIERPDGTRVPKSQQQLDTQEKVRAATIKSINDRTKFVNENSDEWGARKLSNGRVEVGGPNLPLQFDHFVQVPEWLRSKAREFEAGRSKGRSYLYSYNAIGTGEAGSYKIKNLGNVEAKTGEMVPFGWAVSTKNHLLAKVIDLNSFRAAAIRAIDNEQLGEFGNDLRAVETGLKQLLSNYENGVAGETGLGVTRKNILNGLLGTGTVVQRASNPVWHTLNNQGSVRTFRFDRLNYADPHGTGYFPHYNKININALPDDAGRMSLDQYGQFDADRKAAWMNKEAVKRGFTNATNWQNADAQAFQAADGQYRQQFSTEGMRPQASVVEPEIRQDGMVVAPEGQPTFKLTRRTLASFLPDAGVDLADYAERTVIALPADRMGIGEMLVGPRGNERAMSVKGQGGAGFMQIYNGGGWAFSDEATGGRFMKRLREAAGPNENSVIVGITAMSEFNHLKNQTGQLAYVEALEAAIAGRSISKKQADAHIREIAQAIVRSEAASVTDGTRKKFNSIKSFTDFSKAVRSKSLNFADAAPYSVQIARKKLPIPYKEAKEIGIAFDDIGKQTADPRYADVPFGTVVALLEVPLDQSPVKSDFHYSYPYKVTGNSIGFLKKYYPVGELTSDPRVRNKAGAVQAQPLQTVLPKMDRIRKVTAQFLPDTSDAPPFYMKSTQVLDSKIQGKAATVDQVRAILTNPQNGIKAEELKWTGAMQAAERLAKENNGKVPKDALLKYLADDGAVRLEEVTMGGVRKQWTQADIEALERQAQRTRDFSEYERAVLEYEDQQLGSDANNTGNQTRYGQYQLVGGENYREVVLAMPDPKQELSLLEAEYKEINSGQRGPISQEMSDRLTEINVRRNQLEDAAFSIYKSSHFPETPNYVAHMRLNERTDAAGKRGIFIEEIQSDRHQKGREKGYAGDGTISYDDWLKREYSEDEIRYIRKNKRMGEEMRRLYRDFVRQVGASGIEDAPFRKDWPTQMFKRALADAVGSGKEWIGWTTGETQAARYDLSKQISKVLLVDTDGGNQFLYAYGLDGNEVIRRDVKSENIADIIGKEAAEKLANAPKKKQPNGASERALQGVDLKVGGEGMKGFYDQILPKEISKYVKQWGGQVEKSAIGNDPLYTSFEEFAKELNNKPLNQQSKADVAFAKQEWDSRLDTGEKRIPIWRVNITPQMRESIKKAGQALFVGGAAAVVAEEELRSDSR